MLRHPVFGYGSVEAMSYEELKSFVNALIIRFPFLMELKVNAMNLGETHDITYMFDKNADIPTWAEIKAQRAQKSEAV